jgi:hypothetical protein
MQRPFRILFYEKDGNPLDYRCIERFIKAFPKSYQNVVEKIIMKSERLDKRTFGYNLAILMPSFKMTRAGAFHGLRIVEKGIPTDPNNVIGLCWDQIGDELQELKDFIKANASCSRSRVIADLPPKSRDHVIKVTAQLFEKLKNVCVRSSQVGRVGATKVLFAALPEIALPVDNLEWKQVFETDKYDAILSTMANEIIEWEKRVHKPLESLSPHTATTLPAVYNILAMAARDLTKANW